MKIDDLVLLLSKEESYLVRISDRKINTNSGTIDVKKLKKKKFGDEIKTHLGKKFSIIKPTIRDILMKKARRLPQIVMPKDVALILAYTGISSDSKVIDAGTGSGFLSIFLANYLKNGKIITYEKNKKIVENIKNNIKLSGFKNIKLRVKDILKGIKEKNVDMITLDMINAEKVIKHAYNALKPGGWLVVYSPYIEQVIAVRDEIKKRNFAGVKTVESILREWDVDYHTLPKRSGITHTGFITFARKVK